MGGPQLKGGDIRRVKAEEGIYKVEVVDEAIGRGFGCSLGRRDTAIRTLRLS